MANEISKLITPDGVSHDIKDSVARQASYDVSNKVNKTGDTMTGPLALLGSELQLKTTGSSSNDSGDIVWFYGNGQEKARIWTGDNPTSYGESRLNFRSYKSDGSALHNTQLATASDVDAKVDKTGDPTVFKTQDIPEGSANLSATANTHRVTVYRNGLSIPYQADNTNDGGILRVRGTSESDCILELGTWDDSGSGETIQFNYYPTNSQITPTYSVSVPKKSGTIALTSDVDAKLSKDGDTATGKITFNQGIAIRAGSGSNRPPYFIALLESFQAGGAIGYTSQTDMQYAIGVNGDDNHVASTGAALSSDTGKLGLHWYSQTGKIANQPAQYGFLLTCTTGKGYAEQHSIFMEQANGSLYHMGTNGSSSGSPPAYKKIYDSGNLVTSAVSFTRSHASVSYQEGLVCNRFGNVVTFAGYFSCGATIAANTTLYSGLPKPAGGKHIYFTWSGYDFFLHATDGSIRANGQIVSRTYVGTFTYVCA